GCSEAIMVGRVLKTKMYSRWRYLRYIPDLTTARIWLTRLRRDRRPHAILGAIADTLARQGITLIDSTRYTTDQLATTGVMSIRINVKLFAILRERAGAGEMSLELPDAATASMAAEILAAKVPSIADVLPRVAFAVNREYRDRDTILRAGDELALIPPVSG